MLIHTYKTFMNLVYMTTDWSGKILQQPAKSAAMHCNPSLGKTLA